MAVGIVTDFLEKLCSVWRGKLELAKQAFDISFGMDIVYRMLIPHKI